MKCHTTAEVMRVKALLGQRSQHVPQAGVLATRQREEEFTNVQ